MRILLLLVLLSFAAGSLHAEDYVQQRKAQDIARSRYWVERGYTFDPTFMSAASMDRKVNDIDRAKYWKGRGYSFDPTFMSAASMDRKVNDIDRAKYWNGRGYSFDPTFLSAASMDRKVSDIDRAKYWKERGYSFDPTFMSAASMDREIEKRHSPSGAANAVVASRDSSYSFSSRPSAGSSVAVKGSDTTTSRAKVSSGSYYDYNYRPAVGEHYVAPHVRRDGAVVSGHYKTNSDDSFWNNWSSYDNQNPHTGRVGSKLPPGTSKSAYGGSGGSTYVNGYVKSNGTYVSGHSRSK